MNTQIIDDFSFLRPEEPIWPTICWIVGICVVTAYILLRLGIYIRRRVLAWRETTRPRREAMASLEESFPKWQQMGYTKFLFIVVAVLKKYLSDNFSSQAKMLTFDELELAIDQISELSPSKREEVLSLLRECDLACYALATVKEEDISRLYNGACEFVLSTWRKD